MARARGLEKGRFISVIGYTIPNTRVQVWPAGLAVKRFGGHLRSPDRGLVVDFAVRCRYAHEDDRQEIISDVVGRDSTSPAICGLQGRC